MSPAGEASGDLLEETSGSQAWITEIFTGLGGVTEVLSIQQ